MTASTTMHAEGYPMISVPGHPRGAGACSFVFEHILIAERALGRYLPAAAVVHHVDENRGNNARGNHVICENRAYHNLLHKRMRALDTCGHAGWLRCNHCKSYDEPARLRRHGEGHSHDRCHNAYRRERRAAEGKTPRPWRVTT